MRDLHDHHHASHDRDVRDAMRVSRRERNRIMPTEEWARLSLDVIRGATIEPFAAVDGRQAAQSASAPPAPQGRHADTPTNR
jgi:hypothetical protein